jgi:hypothetical protein
MKLARMLVFVQNVVYVRQRTILKKCVNAELMNINTVSQIARGGFVGKKGSLPAQNSGED